LSPTEFPRSHESCKSLWEINASETDERRHCGKRRAKRGRFVLPLAYVMLQVTR
jgi:hypothetical protein